MLVPMYDIDLLWHTHISIDPTLYPDTCIRAIGRVSLSHTLRVLAAPVASGSAVSAIHRPTLLPPYSHPSTHPSTLPPTHSMSSLSTLAGSRQLQLTPLTSTGIFYGHDNDLGMVRRTHHCGHVPAQVFQHGIESLGENRADVSHLSPAFKATKAAWEETYGGQLYDIPGSNYIPPQQVHPVARRMERLLGCYGSPVVERTGAWLNMAEEGGPAWVCASVQEGMGSVWAEG